MSPVIPGMFFQAFIERRTAPYEALQILLEAWSVDIHPSAPRKRCHPAQTMQDMKWGKVSSLDENNLPPEVLTPFSLVPSLVKFCIFWQSRRNEVVCSATRLASSLFSPESLTQEAVSQLSGNTNNPQSWCHVKV